MNKLKQKLKEWLPLTLALCIAVAVYVVLTHLPAIWGAIRTVWGFFSPVFTAAVIAYLVNPLSNFYRMKLLRRLKSEKAKTILSNLLAFITLLAFVALSLWILIPQMIEGASTFVANLDGYLDAVRTRLPEMKIFGNELDLHNLLESREKLFGMLAELFTQNADSLLKTSVGAGRSVMQMVIALFLSIYMLSDKERIKRGADRLLRAAVPVRKYEPAIGFLRRCDQILNRYVVYNLLDAVVIGCVNALFMAICGMPYVGLVSFFVAVTNLIPTFGPIIGAAIGALVLSLVKLRYAIIFLIFTVLLQICDGYLIKPKLFGNSLGVSSLWILVGVVVGGRMFGAAGVLLAIPAVAILDILYKDYVLPRLDARERRKRAELAAEAKEKPDPEEKTE